MPMNVSSRHRMLLSLRSEAALGLRKIQGVRGPIAIVDEPPLEAEKKREIEDLTVDGPVVSNNQKLDGEPVGLFAGADVPAVVVRKNPGAIELPVLSTDKKSKALSELNDQQVRGCTKCRLSETRTQTVFGEGDVDAKIFFIGEGPGENEDLTGRPFVGRAGQLLDKMIAAMGLDRSHVFIANIVKCRPPNNRVPALDEVETCTPYLVKQLEIIRPKVIVTLGLPAAKYMLEDPRLTMGKIRGQWQNWRGIQLMPTYHPSYILRAYTEANRKAVWTDLQNVMKETRL